jgi:hypothetical protein
MALARRRGAQWWAALSPLGSQHTSSSSPGACDPRATGSYASNCKCSYLCGQRRRRSGPQPSVPGQVVMALSNSSKTAFPSRPPPFRT